MTRASSQLPPSPRTKLLPPPFPPPHLVCDECSCHPISLRQLPVCPLPGCEFNMVAVSPWTLKASGASKARSADLSWGHLGHFHI